MARLFSTTCCISIVACVTSFYNVALIPTWWSKACTKHCSPYIIDCYYFLNSAQLYANMFEAFAKKIHRVSGKICIEAVASHANVCINIEVSMAAVFSIQLLNPKAKYCDFLSLPLFIRIG